MMFSDITEAWTHDPVKEMTDKLSKKDMFQTNNFATQDAGSEIFDYRKYVNNATNSPGNNSLSIVSENVIETNTSETDSSYFVPINFDKRIDKKYQYDKKRGPGPSGENLRSYSLAREHNSRSAPKRRHESPSDESSVDSGCDYSVRHLKKCDHCYGKLKKMVSSKVDKKFDELMLDTKMKQLHSMSLSPQIVQYPDTPRNKNSDSWKEILIIVVGIIIVIFFVFLIVKSVYK
jgi:hypothetical protein